MSEEQAWINPEGQEGFPPSGRSVNHPEIPTTLTPQVTKRSPEQNARIRQALERENGAGPAPGPASTADDSGSGASGGKKMAGIAAAVVLGGAVLIGGGLALSGGGSDDSTGSEASSNESETASAPAEGDTPDRLAAVEADSQTNEPAQPTEPVVLSAAEDVSATDEPAQPADSAEITESVDAGDPGDPVEPVEPDEANLSDIDGAAETAPTAPGAQTPPDDADTPVAGSDESVEAGAVGERFGRYSDGKITLVGPVPDQETADRLVASAGEVIGPENVIDEYVIDPSAAAVDDGHVIVDDPVLFTPGSDAINPDFFPLLDLGVTVLVLNPQSNMRITGHTDDAGDAESNLVLSQRRAQIVANYMIDKGIDASRFEIVGAGETQPRGSNDTAAGRAANRRIDVEILNLIGG